MIVLEFSKEQEYCVSADRIVDPTGLSLSMGAGAVLGAELGTAILPGLGTIVGAAAGATVATVATLYTFEKIQTVLNETTSQGKSTPDTSATNTNPFAGPVDKPVIAVDPKGNAIPVNTGEKLAGSKDGSFIQVNDSSGNPTGTRIDGGHSADKHPDVRAQEPHAHVPGKTNSDGTPWLPVQK